MIHPATRVQQKKEQLKEVLYFESEQLSSGMILVIASIAISVVNTFQTLGQ